MLAPSPASAAEGNIDHVETDNGKVQILYSLSGAGESAPDLKSLAVKLDGKSLQATAELASDAAQTLRRTTILAIDVSESMAGDKFTEAKRAAQIFLDSAPADLYVGIVTFAGEVKVAQEPTLDREAATKVVDGLQLSRGTLLYPGIKEAVAQGGKQGQRSIIVLSDGRDTSDVELTSVTAAIKKAAVKVDVVALAQSSGDEALLQPLSDAGKGSVISASDPKALGAGVRHRGGHPGQADPDLGLVAHRQCLRGDARGVRGGRRRGLHRLRVRQPGRVGPCDPDRFDQLAAPASGVQVTQTLMLVGVGALGLGLLALLAAVFGVTGSRKDSVENRIEAYTQKGARRGAGNPAPTAPQGVTAQAVDIANKALASNRGLEVKLGDRLEAAGMSLEAGRVAAAARRHRRRRRRDRLRPDGCQPDPRDHRAPRRHRSSLDVPRDEAVASRQGLQLAARGLSCS